MIYPELKRSTFLLTIVLLNSKAVISNLCFLEDDLGLKVTWNHFAAVGGVVKGKVWIATKIRKTIVNSAKNLRIVPLLNVPRLISSCTRLKKM